MGAGRRCGTIKMQSVLIIALALAMWAIKIVLSKDSEYIDEWSKYITGDPDTKRNVEDLKRKDQACAWVVVVLLVIVGGILCLLIMG